MVRGLGGVEGGRIKEKLVKSQKNGRAGVRRAISTGEGCEIYHVMCMTVFQYELAQGNGSLVK